MSMSAPPVVIQAKEEHSATILFFHGLGDSGHGWASSIAEIVPSYVKVICPTAPIAPVTLNGGYSMTSWFDLLTLDAKGPEDEKGIKAAGELVKSLIEEEEKRGIPTKRILIGGFSQGGGLSIHTTLRYDKPLAGILALSCWLPLHKDYPTTLNPANKDISILMCHGDADVIVPFHWGKKSADMMKAFVPNIEFKTYSGMGHSSCPQEMRDAREFIRKVLPAP